MLGYNPVSDRIISARFKSLTSELVIIQTYAPTASATDAVIDRYYDELQKTVNVQLRNATLILMGDMNAKVGKPQNANGSTGKFGLGSQNERGERLV